MKSEMKMPRDRDREVKCQQNSREFSRNETLAGYCLYVTQLKAELWHNLEDGFYLGVVQGARHLMSSWLMSRHWKSSYCVLSTCSTSEFKESEKNIQSHQISNQKISLHWIQKVKVKENEEWQWCNKVFKSATQQNPRSFHQKNLSELLLVDESIPIKVKQSEGDVGNRLLRVFFRHPPE